MNLSSRRILFPVAATALLLANCVPAPAATQDPALVEQMIEQSVSLTLAAENAQAKDQQLIEQAVALTVAAQNVRATEQQAVVAALTPSPTAESVALPGGLAPTTTAETVILPGGSDSTTAVDPLAPVINKIDPPEGPTRGGTVVSIIGENFVSDPVTQFFFGENPATGVSCDTDKKCFAVSPSGKEGTVLVRAVNGDRQSQHVEGNVLDGFKYNGPPKYGCDVLTTAPRNLSVFKSGQNFAVKWIVRNSGLRTWPAGLDLKYSSGVNMANITRTEIPGLMKPGDTYAIKLDAEAPTNPGKYYMTWIVEGMGCSAYVAIVVE